MVNLDISIGSIKSNVMVNDGELADFEDLVKFLNLKVNELHMEVGRINDRLIFFAIILIITNKKAKVFNNFRNDIVRLLREMTKFFSPLKDGENAENAEHKLVKEILLLAHKTKYLPDEDIETNNNLNSAVNQVSNEEIKKNNDKILEIIDNIIEAIDKISDKVENINEPC
jgi:hypothetical protein